LLPGVPQEAIMAIDERSRNELYRRLEEVLGSEAATTLIEYLPPVGWADVATRHDLAGLEQRIDLRFELVDEHFNRIVDESIRAATSDLRATFEHELRSQSSTFEHELRSQSSTFERELRSQTTTMVFGLVGVVLTMAALAFALVSFT
jgi:hypothetical protein